MTGLPILLVLIGLAGAMGPAANAPSVSGDLPRLRELLYSRQQAQEQSQAAMLLTQSQLPEAEELIRAGLRRHDRPDVFQALATAIRLRRDARFVHLLITALGSEQGAIRRAAEESLARLPEEATHRQLLATAEDQAASITSRLAAVSTLGRSMKKTAAIALLSLLSNDAAQVRQAAVAALEEMTGHTFGADVFQWQSWWEQSKDQTDEEWLAGRTAYFMDRSRRLRGDLDHAEAQILQLQRTLYSKIPAADRPRHLHALVQSEGPAVRAQVVAWIAELLPDAGADQKQLIESLLALSEDGVESVQRQAVLALEKVTDARAFQRLLVLLRSAPVSVRAAAARSLGHARNAKTPDNAGLNQQAITALDKALTDPSLTVVAEAAESLGNLGVPEAAPLLAGLLRHPSDSIRQAAARALEPLANESILVQLYGGLDDPSPAVRFNLVGALGRIGGAASRSDQHHAAIVTRLEHVLVHDDDPGVRSRAATVIGDLGASAQLPILWQRVIATEDNRVQVKAWRALVEILCREGEPGLAGKWEQTLKEQNHSDRRLELLTEVRTRWSKQEGMKARVDGLTPALIDAQLAQKKWNQALPLARELAGKAADDAELAGSLRLLLAAANQALEEKQPQPVLETLKGMDQLLSRSAGLAAEFERLRQRALKH